MKNTATMLFIFVTLVSTFGACTHEAYATERLLFIGDSHLVGDFGTRVEEYFQGSAKVDRVGSCGTTLRSWWTRGKTRCGFYSRVGDQPPIQKKEAITPDLKAVLELSRPTRVVLVFGTNYISHRAEEIQEEASKALGLVKESGADCIFVGPPDSRTYRAEVTRVDQVLQRAVGSRCVYFQSRTATSYPPRGGDGVHFANATAWADAFFKFWPPKEAE